jgi:predicted lysophospholipase L1 biosynthesis ABC-type transport system permease subunit
VAIVSRALAERYWPGEDAIGRRLARATAPPQWLTVIGVASDVRDVGLGQASEPTVYIPYAQNNAAVAPITLVVRTASDPMPLAGAIRETVRAVDPAQPVDGVIAIEAFLGDTLGPQRLRSTLLLLLAAIGLLIAAVGIYGVTARSVHERTREVGVRIALGASPHRVWRLVVAGVMGAVGGGLAVGGVLTLVMGRLLAGRLPDVSAADVWAAGPALAVLVGAAGVAAAWPAWRAAGLDPARALRAD